MTRGDKLAAAFLAAAAAMVMYVPLKFSGLAFCEAPVANKFSEPALLSPPKMIAGYRIRTQIIPKDQAIQRQSDIIRCKIIGPDEAVYTGDCPLADFSNPYREAGRAALQALKDAGKTLTPQEMRAFGDYFNTLPDGPFSANANTGPLPSTGGPELTAR